MGNDRASPRCRARRKPGVSRAVVIVAAGRGERMGVRDKAELEIAGAPVIDYSLRAAADATAIGDIVVVSTQNRLEWHAGRLEALDLRPTGHVVAGGASRQSSVARGVEKAHALGARYVAIHDAARPLARPALFDQVFAAAERTGGAIAALPVADTIKKVDNMIVAGTIDRTNLWHAQTPQAFATEKLLAALAIATERSLDFTDEAGLFELLGWEVEVVPGDPANLKLTYPHDWPLIDAIATARKNLAEPGQK